MILVEDGNVVEGNLKRQRLTQKEVAATARLQNIGSLSRVKWAVLETGGQISFIKKN